MNVRFPLVLVIATCAVGIAAGASIMPLDGVAGPLPSLDILGLEFSNVAQSVPLDPSGLPLGPPSPLTTSSPTDLGMHATLHALAVAPTFLPFPLLPGDEMILGGSDILFTHGASGSTASAMDRAISAPAIGPSSTPLASSGSPSPGAPEAAQVSSATTPGSGHTQSTKIAPPPAPSAAVVAASGAALGLLGLLGIALYHRIRPTTTLENDTRKHIFAAVCETPGLGVHIIASQAGVSYSTATYHLERLVAAGMIVMTPDGNKLCYYKNGGAFTEAERRILPILKNDEAAKLLEAILENPGTYRAALAERLGVTATTINWHLRRLREANLVQENRQGRNAYLYANVLTLQQSLPGLAQKLSVTDVAVADRIRRYVGHGSSGMSASS